MIRTLTLAIVCAFTLSTQAIAEPPGGPGMRGPGHGPPPPHEIIRRHADELGIDDQTVQDIVELAEQARSGMRTHHDTVREARETLHRLLQADAPNRQQVMKQVDVVASAEAAQRKHQLSTLIDIRALLTVEQRQRLHEFHEKQRAKHPRGGGGPPPHGPGGGKPPPPGFQPHR